VITVLAFVCAITVQSCTPGTAFWKQRILGFGSVADACATGQEVARNTGVAPGTFRCVRVPPPRS
jgi:hypothetical protein